MAIGDFGADLEEIWLDDQPPESDRPVPHVERPFGDLDPVTAKEVLAELTAAAF